MESPKETQSLETISLLLSILFLVVLAIFILDYSMILLILTFNFILESDIRVLLLDDGFWLPLLAFIALYFLTKWLLFYLFNRSEQFYLNLDEKLSNIEKESYKLLIIYYFIGLLSSLYPSEDITIDLLYGYLLLLFGIIFIVIIFLGEFNNTGIIKKFSELPLIKLAFEKDRIQRFSKIAFYGLFGLMVIPLLLFGALAFSTNVTFYIHSFVRLLSALVIFSVGSFLYLRNIN